MTEQSQSRTSSRPSIEPPWWFMDHEGDVYLITSDEIKFRASRQRLAYESDVFRDMFQVVHPSGEGMSMDGTEEDPIKIEESSEVFDTLLLHVYQQSGGQTVLVDLEHHLSSIAVARKYLMARVTKSLVDTLMASKYLKSNPGRMYAFACLHGLPELAKLASKETLHCGILNVNMGKEGEMITGRHYQDLISRHRQRVTRSLAIIDDFEQSMEPRGSKNAGYDQGHPWARAHYPLCSCNSNSNRLPQWFYHFCTYARMELNRAPVSDHLFSGKAMLSILRGVECRDCSKNMHDNWEKLEQLRKKIDTEDTGLADVAYDDINYADGDL